VKYCRIKVEIPNGGVLDAVANIYRPPPFSVLSVNKYLMAAVMFKIFINPQVPHAFFSGYTPIPQDKASNPYQIKPNTMYPRGYVSSDIYPIF